MASSVAALINLLAKASQQERLLRLHTPFGADELVAETFVGRDELTGSGFRYELTALSTNAHLDLEVVIGQPVLLELLPDDSRTELRPFHGHVTAFERIASNGGFARYRLVLEPWLAFLGHRVDSYVFQDKTVTEIVDDLFADYAEAGALAPAWRWELADRERYHRRSLTTQYHETDLAFVQRLLAEEGIFWWFEHAGDAQSEQFGSHTLVLGDHNEAFGKIGEVRFHRADATETRDGIQQWSSARRWQTTSLDRASWDYRSLGQRPGSAEGQQYGTTSAHDHDPAGPYAWQDDATGQYRARQHMEALEVESAIATGSGSWRRLDCGSRFGLTQHAVASGDYVCLEVHHQARNNFDAEMFDALEAGLGPVTASGTTLPEALGGEEAPSGLSADPFNWATTDLPIASAVDPRAAQDHGDADAGFYRNRFKVIAADVPYRPRTVDGHGLRAHPRPTIHGTLSAIVVSDGGPVLTDRDHRIKVQFNWQRGGDASSGTSHPGGDDNAPGSDGAWTWVRVATPWAGDNWGGVVIPRRGQEVIVAFMEGDIDRPVIVGTVYNGRGQPDAQFNNVSSGGGGATGNAAVWFEGNDHAAIYTGFKSQSLASSQEGSGGYQQLRLDDTPAQGRAQLSTTQHTTTLTLGHLKGGLENVREGERGYGIEANTQANGAIRAGSGLLLTTESGSIQLSAAEAIMQLEQSEQLLQTLAKTAKTQLADLPDEPEPLRAQQSLKDELEDYRATTTGSLIAGGGDGETSAWARPHLLGASPDGIVSLTARDQHWVSGTQTRLIAGNDIDWVSQDETVIAVADGMSIFTHGGEPPKDKPNQERGIAMHAAQGMASARVHKNLAKFAAKDSVKIASTQADINISAPLSHFLATAVGAYIKIEGGDIELGAPGKIEFKASQKEWAGPMSASDSVEIPTGILESCQWKT